MRNIFLVRLILIFFPFLPGAFKQFLINFRSIFDLISVKKFDLSINLMPYPITTRGGTEIKAGLLIDIEDFNFFSIIKLRRVYIHVSFLPPGLEVHIFIDPFGFEIGGVVVLSVAGTNRDQTLEARKKTEEADKKRADDEKIAMVRVSPSLSRGMTAPLNHPTAGLV